MLLCPRRSMHIVVERSQRLMCADNAQIRKDYLVVPYFSPVLVSQAHFYSMGVVIRPCDLWASAACSASVHYKEPLDDARGGVLSSAQDFVRGLLWEGHYRVVTLEPLPRAAACAGARVSWPSAQAHHVCILLWCMRVCGLELRQAHARVVCDRGTEAGCAGPGCGVQQLAAKGALALVCKIKVLATIACIS